MGLLDDAIREHLDLKRRRGADPGEVERAEREALGRVRRKGEDPAAEFDQAAASAGVAAYDRDDEDAPLGQVAYDRDEDDWALEHPDELNPADSGSEPELDVYLEAKVEEDRPRSRLFGRLRRDPDLEDEAVADDEAPDPRMPPPAASGHTAEYDVDEALGTVDDDAEDEDVLEETPEFLQDTPDHDRLWFEQRPPKDFDFDG